MVKSSVRQGFSLIELLVVLAVIGLLVAVLLPALVTARSKANQATCVSHERQIGLALTAYTADSDGGWPWHTRYQAEGSQRGKGWGTAIEPYLKTSLQNMTCPDAKQMPAPVLGYVPGYAYNTALEGSFPADTQKRTVVHDADIPYRSATVSICEEPWTKGDAWGPDPWHPDRLPSLSLEQAWKRHHGGADYLFCDGHVRWYLPKAVGYNVLGTNDGSRPTFALDSKPS